MKVYYTWFTKALNLDDMEAPRECSAPVQAENEIEARSTFMHYYHKIFETQKLPNSYDFNRMVILHHNKIEIIKITKVEA